MNIVPCMRNIVFFLLLLNFRVALAQSQPSLPVKEGSSTQPFSGTPAWSPGKIDETSGNTSVEWFEEEFDFGKVKAGDTVSHTYRFKNIGSLPLVISQVKPSCGCTSPRWSKDPIAPGKEGYVEIVFDTRAKEGYRQNSITLILNTEEGGKVLRFKGMVE